MNDKSPDDKRRQPLLKRVASKLDSFLTGVVISAIGAGIAAYLTRRKQKSLVRQASIETQARSAPASPSRKPSTIDFMLWGLALSFGVLALVAVVRQSDGWWDVLLYGALSVFFAITGVGVWQRQKWGFVLLTVGLIVLIISSYVIYLRDADMVKFVFAVLFLVPFLCVAADNLWSWSDWLFTRRD